MPVGIERKFLVCGNEWRHKAHGQRYCQGYLALADGVTVRVRRAGQQAFLTIKGPARGLVRPEFEYPIPVDEAEAMFKLCHRPLIEKTRYEILYEGLVWQVAEFAGDNDGLVLVEVELGDRTRPVELPPWVGQEVIHDERFRNSSLVDNPQGEPTVEWGCSEGPVSGG